MLEMLLAAGSDVRTDDFAAVAAAMQHNHILVLHRLLACPEAAEFISCPALLTCQLEGLDSLSRLRQYTQFVAGPSQL